MKYKSILHLTVAAVLMVLSAACEKFSPEPPELLLTLDGKPYQLRELNSLRGLPGEEITFGITVKGNDRKQVSFTVTRDGFMNAQASFDQQTRTGTFTIMVADLNDSYGSVKLNFKAGDMTVSYVFNIQSETFSYDTPESVTCNSGPGDETEISFQFSTTVDNPQIEAVLKDGTSFELVSLDYSRSDDDGIWDASVVVRNKKENKTGYDNTDCLVIQHAVKRTYTRAEIRLSQPPEDPPHVDGCVFIRNWPLKRALNEIADTDGDGEISFAEADAIKRLDLHGKNLNTTEGLDVFHNLEWIDLSSNPKLTEILLDDPGSFSRTKYIKARFGDAVRRTLNLSGCYSGPSLTIDTDEGNSIVYGKPKTYYSNHDLLAPVELVREHTKGNGNLIFEFAYHILDVDYYSGAFREYAEWCFDKIFEAEPLRIYKDYFDLIIVPQFSYSNLPSGVDDTQWSCGGHKDHEKWEKEYDVYFKRKKALLIKVVNMYSSFLGTTGRPSSQIIRYSLEQISGESAYIRSIYIGNGRFRSKHDPNDILHECGHTVAGLYDQYVTYNGVGNWEREYENVGKNMERNMFNTDDPEQVPWKRFFAIERYRGRVGIYRHEGNGFYYPSDPQLSENHMCMHDEQEHDRYFDSVGRWCFFRNLGLWAGVYSTPEEAWQPFLEYDIINDDLPD